MKNLIAPIILSLVAAASSVICARLSIPVWTMFIGWIAFVAGGMRAGTAAPTFVSAVLGVVLGIVGALIIGGTTAAIGADLALLVGVFVIVLIALLAQYVPFVNVVVCYFIGMTTFFASGLPPEAPTALALSTGLLVGVLSGLLAVTIAGMLDRKTVEAPA